MSKLNRSTRREFLKHAAAVSAGALAVPYFVPASALGQAGATAPSDRIVMGCIGTGGKGVHNMQAFMGNGDVQMVAVCDVDARHLNGAREIVNKQYGNQDCAATKDFRELVAREDIDAVCVSTPDHWHALASVAAANAGKDIYCEKPLANSVGEGRAICDAVKKNNRVLQTGSHERSGDNARFACELVRNGRLGKLHTIRINLPCSDSHHEQVRQITGVPPEMPVPEGFDYDFWLGHTPQVPYTEKRCHFWWRFILNYGGGEMTDRGAHIIDLAQLGAGMDDTGPVEIEATGTRSKTSLYDAFMDYQFVNTYANGLKMIGANEGPRGLKFEGSDGSLFIHIHGAQLEADPASLLEEKIGEDEIHLGRSPGHHRNFLDSVKSRQQPVAPAEAGHRTGSICHLNNIAMLTGRKFRWDPASEHIQDDDEASALLTPKMRSPWSL
ncbi:MAG: Gfo/Idh/MocA family oxidoreductase [Pirellulales bacterium]